MVYTVTFNPAIDYVVHTGEMKLGSTNRSDREEMYFGGKGINVSIVLRELDIQSKALGFTAGFTGEAIENGLAEMGIDTDFVHLKKGNSRINVKIKSAEETELNGVCSICLCQPALFLDPWVWSLMLEIVLKYLFE